MKEWKLLCVLMMGALLAGCASGLTSDMSLSNQAFSEIQKSQYVEAERDCKAALAINPNNCYALNNLGFVYKATGRNSLAKEAFGKVIALNPQELPSRMFGGSKTERNLVQIARDNLAAIQQ
jgi:Flp pilus assembly protein TadD